MHKLLMHPLDQYPALKAFLDDLPVEPEGDALLAQYRRLAAAYLAVERRITGGAANEDAIQALVENGADQVAADEHIDRYLHLAIEQQPLADLRRALTVRIGRAISAWILIVRPPLQAEHRRRAKEGGKRDRELEPARQAMRNYGSGYGLEGTKKAHFEQLTQEVATLEPIREWTEEAKKMLDMLDGAADERFWLERRATDMGMRTFLQRVGLDPKEIY